MTHLIVTVFLLVYLGMIFGGLPFVQLDRAGIALLGAIALVATESVSIEDALRSLHPADVDAAILLHGNFSTAAPGRLLFLGDPPTGHDEDPSTDTAGCDHRGFGCPLGGVQ